MGRGRSVADLWRKYAKADKNLHPTQSYPTLRNWAARFDWKDRAGVYDAELERQKNALRQEIMQSGLALDYKRAIELKRLAHFLIEQVYEQGENGNYHNVWLPDVKQIGAGKNIERIDIERFNAAIISELRGVLDDLAKETGGRRLRQEITGAEGGPLLVGNVQLTTEQQERALKQLAEIYAQANEEQDVERECLP